MNRIYVLYHIHKFDEVSECQYGHEDKKLIGVFYEKPTAIMERYKALEGFKDFKEGFQIHEYLIDSIYNQHINEFLEQNIARKQRLGQFYCLYYLQEYEDGHEDIKLLGVFSSQKNADVALEQILNIPELNKLKNYFSIHAHKENLLGWQTGFNTVK